jgi:hypothetical protein
MVNFWGVLRVNNKMTLGLEEKVSRVAVCSSTGTQKIITIRINALLH